MENGWTERIEELEAEVAKLTAERDADRRREYGYSQQTVDALTAERDSLKHLYDKALGDLVKDSQRISELKEENQRLRELVDGATVAVELFKDTAPAQKKWRQEWLKKARQALKEASHEGHPIR